ncbi:YybH family protein [Microbacterium suaedae]|uniref:YybH family protein n=1 Tax=Microbacterium suaedae TaxID=2067813 RepID=UPI000DA203D8|nr:nuclear transport factor 2 family protein [Microbacterium suaedae]
MTRVDDALDAYLAATNTHDFDEVAECLAPDAVYFFGDATCVGMTSIRAYFERTWALLPDERYWASNVTWVARGTDTAVAVYAYHWTGTIDGEARSGIGRATNVFARTAEGWLLTHEHLSGVSGDSDEVFLL